MFNKIIAATSPQDFITKIVDQTKCECYADITKICVHCFAKIIHRDKFMSPKKRLELYHVIRGMERQLLQRRQVIPPEKIKAYLRTISDIELMNRYKKLKEEKILQYG